MATDKIGQEITVGDYIAYGHALGRSAGLRIGKVLSINEEANTWRDKKTTHFTIIGVDGEWSHREPRLLSKKSTLQFSERIIVLPPEKVPPKIKKLLDEFQS